MSGNNGYTGGTTVTAGKLVVSNSSSSTTISGTGTGPVSITNATLAGTGTILGDTTVGTGSMSHPATPLSAP